MKENITRLQTKPPVDREGVRLLAIELGASAAARKLGLSPNTVRNWAKRYNWNLPARAGRPAIVPATDLQRPGDILLQDLKQNEEATRTSMSIAARRAAEATAARSEKFPAWAKDPQELQQLASAMARIFGWSTAQAPSVNYYGDVNTVVVCDENRRKQLIEQRQRLLEQEARGKVIELNGHKTEAAVPVTPETQPNASAGAGSGIVAQDQSPAAQQDSVFRHMQSIGRAESWKTEKGSEQENHAGSFRPYPEEYE
jgi:transposase